MSASDVRGLTIGTVMGGYGFTAVDDWLDRVADALEAGARPPAMPVFTRTAGEGYSPAVVNALSFA